MKVTITQDDGTTSSIDTEGGYLLFYFKGDKIKTSGNIDIKALAPILTRIALEKLSK